MAHWQLNSGDNIMLTGGKNAGRLWIGNAAPHGVVIRISGQSYSLPPNSEVMIGDPGLVELQSPNGASSGFYWFEPTTSNSA